MSLSKLCQLRSGASRAYSTAVGKEVVIVGCARSCYHSRERMVLYALVQDSHGRFQRLIGFFFCSPGAKSIFFKENLLDTSSSLELWLYLQPLSGLVAQKKQWMRSIWGLSYRFTEYLTLKYCLE